MSIVLEFSHELRREQDAFGFIEQKETPMVRKLIIPVLALAAVGLYVGCNRFEPGSSPSAEITAAVPTSNTQNADHHDKPGSHGGLIVSLGADNYHAEAVFEHGGKLRLHILGKDEARIQEVEQQDITAN